MTKAFATLPRANDDVAFCFPDIDPGIRPLGNLVLVQIRFPKRKTRSGIIIADDSRDHERWNAQVARVVSVGPVAFRHRDTLEYWPECKSADGSPPEHGWVKPGDFVRVPIYGGDKIEIPHPQEPNESVVFATYKDTSLYCKLTSADPVEMKAYLPR